MVNGWVLDGFACLELDMSVYRYVVAVTALNYDLRLDHFS